MRQLNALIILGLLQACSGSTEFSGGQNTATPTKQANEDSQPPESTQNPEARIAPEAETENAELQVILPANEIRAGGQSLQAKAQLSDGSAAEVVWKLSGPDGQDLGSINADGLYTSPKKLKSEIVVQIIASLASDPSVSSSKTLKVIPQSQLFVDCQQGSNPFPITADVFELPVGTPDLPDFSTMQKKQTVCLDKFDIPQQDWLTGFPSSPQLVEWFGLHTETTLIVPVSGVYKFRLAADDGASLWIDGNLLIDNSGQHSMISKDASISLSAGKHELMLDWYQGPRTALGLQLFWQGPGKTSFEIIPSSAFSL